MNGQHTPGPWNIATPKGTLCAWRIVSNDDCNVAFIAQRLNHAEDANARLIAAAPRLFKELKHLLKLWEESIGNEPDYMSMGDSARAAIAEAEGRLP